MLQLFYGSDTLGVRDAALQLIDELLSQAYQLERVETKSLTRAKLRDMAKAVSLFGEKTVYILDNPSEEAENFGWLLGFLDQLQASDNVIVVIANNLLAAEKKPFVQAGATITEYKAVANTKAYDPFLINKALLVKDKKTMWLLLIEAGQLSIPTEEIIGIIWWQLKTLRLVNLFGSATEAGIKPYSYDQSKRALRNFKAGEIEQLSRKLLAIYHEARAGRRDLALGLEQWVLSI